MTACIEEYVPEPADSTPRLVVKAELDAGETLPSMHLGTSFTALSEELELGDRLDVALYENGDTRPKPFRRVSDNSRIWRAEDPVIFQPGILYFLNIDGTAYGLPPVLAETVVPFAGGFTIGEYTLDSQTNELKLTLYPEAPPGNRLYYHLELYLMQEGNIEYLLNPSKFTHGINAVHSLESRSGILIDYERLPTDKYLSFSVFLDAFDENVTLQNENLYFRLKTVTEDYYLYYQSLDKHLSTIQNPFSLPEITYSNIVNGYGLFTAFSTKLDSVRIQ